MLHRALLLFGLGIGFGTAAIAPATAQVVVDPALSEYTVVTGVSGSIKSVGSDTMNNLMTLWGEGFRALYPNVQIEIEGKGSSTAPPALISGAATLGPMSREMKVSEVEEFERRFGYKPLALRTCVDMLAVYVHRDNPLPGLTLAQVDAIFSSTRNSGYPREIRLWGDLGLKAPWAARPLSLYGRNAASGTYGYFKEHALAKGDFKNGVKEQPGSSSVVQSIGRDRFAMGYSGIGFRTSDVRALPLAAGEGEEFVPASPEHAYDGSYPLSRFLLLYVNRRPDEALPPLTREFVRFVFSRQGQTAVIKDGYYPADASLARAALTAAGL